MKFKTTSNHTVSIPSAITQLAIILMFSQQAFTQSTLVTISEDSAQTTSSLANTSVFTFNNLPNGINTNVAWDGVGTFDRLYIADANVWGGAYDASTGQASQFSWQGRSWTQTSTLTLDQSSAYFGFWWSAGDRNNRLTFYSGDSVVAQYTTASMFSGLNLSPEYYGNPLTGGNSREPYAFINFYGGADTSWDRIELTQTGGGGFESDNYTTRVESYNPEIDEEADIGKVVAQISGTTTENVSNPTTTWVWSFEQNAPGAPTPPVYALILFAVAFAAKDALQKRNRA